MSAPLQRVKVSAAVGTSVTCYFLAGQTAAGRCNVIELMLRAGTGLSKFAWLARSVARNRSVLFPPAASAAAGGGGSAGGSGVMNSAQPTSEAPQDDMPPQTSNVRHNGSTTTLRTYYTS